MTIKNRYIRYAQDILIQSRLYLGQETYWPFIVLGRHRVGSNFLVTALQRRADTATYGEIFFKREIFWGGRLHYWPPFMSEKKLRAQRDQDPIGFLEKRVFRPYAPEVKAVGFKAFYNQLNLFPSVKEYLIEHPSLRVIHLKRRNLLNILISERRAKQLQHKSMLATSEAEITKVEKGIKPFYVSTEDCKRFFEA